MSDNFKGQSPWGAPPGGGGSGNGSGRGPTPPNAVSYTHLRAHET